MTQLIKDNIKENPVSHKALCLYQEHQELALLDDPMEEPGAQEQAWVTLIWHLHVYFYPLPLERENNQD